MSWAAIIIALNSTFGGNPRKTLDELIKEKINDLGENQGSIK